MPLIWDEQLGQWVDTGDDGGYTPGGPSPWDPSPYDPGPNGPVPNDPYPPIPEPPGGLDQPIKPRPPAAEPPPQTPPPTNPGPNPPGVPRVPGTTDYPIPGGKRFFEYPDWVPPDVKFGSFTAPSWDVSPFEYPDFEGELDLPTFEEPTAETFKADPGYGFREKRMLDAVKKQGAR